jgi:hypothetical protein
MRRLRGLVLLAGSVAAWVGCGGAVAQEAGGSAPPGDASAVEFVTAFVGAIDSRDATAIRAAVADDDRFVWLEDGAVRYRGIESLIEGLGAYPGTMRLRTTLSGLTAVPLDGRSMHVFGEFTTSVGDGEGAYRFVGAMTVILERSDRWRVVGGHTSTGSRR